jgi:hypothetical protein
MVLKTLHENKLSSKVGKTIEDKATSNPNSSTTCLSSCLSETFPSSIPAIVTCSSTSYSDPLAMQSANVDISKVADTIDIDKNSTNVPQFGVPSKILRDSVRDLKPIIMYLKSGISWIPSSNI